MPAGPKAMLGGALGGGIPPPAIAPMVTSAPQQQLFTKEFAPPSRESSPGQSSKWLSFMIPIFLLHLAYSVVYLLRETEK